MGQRTWHWAQFCGGSTLPLDGPHRSAPHRREFLLGLGGKGRGGVKSSRGPVSRFANAKIPGGFFRPPRQSDIPCMLEIGHVQSRDSAMQNHALPHDEVAGLGCCPGAVKHTYRPQFRGGDTCDGIVRSSGSAPMCAGISMPHPDTAPWSYCKIRYG